MYSKNYQLITSTPIAFLLLFFILLFGFKSYTQQNSAVLDETVIGYTSYDLQTNKSMCRRVATNEVGDFTFAAWTMGSDFTNIASNRGTGFNVYNRNTGQWDAIPKSRIETTTRTGWPNIGYSQNRQFSVTHSNNTGLQFTYRDGFEDSWKTKDVGSLVGDTYGVWARAAHEQGKIYCLIGRQGLGDFSQEFGGIDGGVNFIRSLDNGDTWESTGALEENYTNSFAKNSNIDGDNYNIDVKDGKIAIVMGGTSSQLYLFTSMDEGSSWSKSVVQSNNNPLQENLGSDNEPDYSIEHFFGNYGSTVIIDNNGLTHIVFSGKITYDYDEDYTYYVNCFANALFYWNENMQAPEIIGNTVINDADNDGSLGNALNTLEKNIEWPADFPYYPALVCQPQLGIDESNNLYVSYTAHVDGAYVPETIKYKTIDSNTNDTISSSQNFEPKQLLFTDVFLIKSIDGGTNWEGPLNATKTNNLEEVYPSIQRNIKDTITMIYQRDVLPGILLQEPQELATINEIVAVKILPEAINNEVAPSDSEPYIALTYSNIYIPYGCDKLEPYLEHLYILDYPEGLLNDFEIIGEIDFEANEDFEIQLTAADGQGQYSDTALVKVNIIEDEIAPQIRFENECEEFFMTVNEAFELPQPKVVDYYYNTGNRNLQNKCDITVNIDSADFDIETIGTYTIVYTATDLSDNITVKNITINVVDPNLEGPKIIAEIPSTIEFGSKIYIEDWQISAIEGSNCKTAEVTVEGFDNLNVNQLGTYEITLTAIGENGNSTTEIFSIDVIDTTPPVLTLNGDYFTQITDYSQCSESGFWDETVDFGVTAIDNVDGDISDQVTVAYNYGQGISCDNNGEFDVVYTATDLNNNSATFERIVVIDLPVILPNNNCEDATTLNTIQISACGNEKIEFSDFEDNKGDLKPSCIGNDNYDFYDVFYEVTVPQSGSLYLKIEGNYYIYAAMYDACNGNELFCGQIENDYPRIDSLPAGETIILQLFTQSTGSFSFCLIDPVPNTNNICTEALPLNISPGGECESTAVTTNFTFDNYTNSSDCNYSFVKNVFYKFIAPATGKIRIKPISNSFGAIIYETSCNGTEIFCDRYIDDVAINELVPGNEYILELLSNSFNNVIFCVEDGTPTSNNICSNAIPVVVLNENECTQENLTETYIANNTYQTIPNCENGIDRDLYYSFEVPLNGQVEINVSNWRIGCAIYDSCNGNSLFCAEDRVQGLIAKGLPVGETVIIQFFEDTFTSTGVFGFCFSESNPPANDICANAELIEIQNAGECITYNYTNTIDFEKANFDQRPSCTNNQNEDIYFKAVVPENGIINIKTNDEVYLTIYDACFGNEILCNHYLDNYINNIIKKLPANSGILLQFSRYNDTTVSFCIEKATESDNNTCEKPLLIPVNNFGECNYIEANNVANDPSVNPACESNTNADMFYQFIVPASGQIKIKGDNFGAAIYNSCIGNTIFCSKDIDENIVYNLTPSDTLLLQLFQKGRTSAFEFCLEDAPPGINNVCELAQELTVLADGSCEDGSFVEINIINNTPNINPVCAANVVADAFYSLTVPANGRIFLKKTYAPGYTGLAIYDTCYGSSIYCSEQINNKLISGLPAGETVIFQFFQSSYELENFNVCLTEVPFPKNNNCVDAPFIPVNALGTCNENIITADLKFATKDTSTFCNDSYTKDVFFKVIVPSSGTIKINSYSSYFYYSIYNACGGNAVSCGGDVYLYDFDVIYNLKPNTEIILQIQPDYNSEVSFCLEEVFQSVNNLCENARAIDVVEASACISLPVNVDNSYNTADVTPDNCNRNFSDSFYNITVPPSGKLSIISSNDDINIALYESCTGGSIFCSTVDYNSGDLLIENLTAGAQLILQVFQSSDPGEFDICVADPVINNSCENATLLCKETTLGTNLTAGSDSNFEYNSCDFYDYYNVWYQLQPTSTTTIKVSFTNCIGTYVYLNVGIFKGSCDDNLEDIECKNLGNFSNPVTLSIDEVEDDENYYLYISSDDYDYDDVCNFQIKVIEGLELNCCQFDVDLIPWCFPDNTSDGYYVDVVTSDFGLSPGGYIVNSSSRINITETGTTTLGPFTNGANNLTFTGIDDASCVYTKTVDFDCANCAAEINHKNIDISRAQTFKAASLIESNANVTSPALNYFAQDSVILQPGFSVDTLTDFTIDIIEDCD